MNQAKRYLITSALPYANGLLHIGHLSGAYLPADIYVRFLRLMGKDAVFVCGSDEHGAAITLRAKKEGISPQEIIDKYHSKFKEAFDAMNISFDIYHRTSEEIHHSTAQDFFKVLYDKGVFEEKVSQQYYDAAADQFLADRYITGTCPKCSHPSAYGDQCENCGSTLSPLELIDAKSTLTGNTPELKETKHWYLPLDKDEAWLTDYIVNGKLDGVDHHDPDGWKNHVIGQCKSWIEGGLQARAMTRDLEWGVSVPDSIPDHEGKKLYVWMDAPIGYISATKQWAADNGKNWEDYWKSEDSEIVHFIGKDNIVFHCIIFPSILKSHGDYNLPVNVPANQFMNLEGQKISTSRNWAIWVNDFIENWSGSEDVMRYVLTKNMPELRDSEFTWKSFQDANNNELVNNLANFVNRVMVLVNKYYEGVVPEFDEDQDIIGPRDTEEFAFHDSEFLSLFDEFDSYCDSIRKFRFRDALKKVMEISSYGNQLLQFNEPWKLSKTDPEKTKAVMNLAIQYVAGLSVLLHPIMPSTSDRLRAMLNLEKLEGKGELLELMDRMAEGEHILPAGHKVNQPEHLFSRIDDERIAQEVARLNAGDAVEVKNPIKDPIDFDHFMGIDLRTATILNAEKVPKTDKLLKLDIDLGFEKRTIVSGIAEYFSPEEVEGKEVVIVANLQPRKLRGIMSEGMILMAEDDEGALAFVSPQDGWGKGLMVK